MPLHDRNRTFRGLSASLCKLTAVPSADFQPINASVTSDVHSLV
jgi:hypothetical protein